MKRRRKIIAALLVVAATAFTAATWISLRPIPKKLSLEVFLHQEKRVPIFDRNGIHLSSTYQNAWNVQDYVPLSEIPEFLQKVFVESEDRNFFEHHGVDWRSRLAAAWQDLKHRRVVRGASTITEQVVRILHPRNRNLWTKWIESIEAYEIERKFSKASILEFYLNEVPFARGRRGVVQAARDYFDRDLFTLSPKEMMALGVLVRAPTRLDLLRNPNLVQKPISLLAKAMIKRGDLTPENWKLSSLEPLHLHREMDQPPVGHFVRYIRERSEESQDHRPIRTTLDLFLQERIQKILSSSVHELKSLNVTDAAVLVADVESNEVLAWVNAGNAFSNEDGAEIDAVLSPRQPGSTIKPFLYALALEKNWTAATLIDDEPLDRPVGFGLHRFKNYSQHHYGPIRLREALANSLNIPAVLTIEYVGVQNFFHLLKELGFETLNQPADRYNESLGLGAAEVSLFDLVQAYAVLARHGVFQRIHYRSEDENLPNEGREVFSEEVSSLISDILSDDWARSLEFGHGHTLHFPMEVAAKTGTSTDYRDAWAVGYTNRYVVGVWMGNLNEAPMKEVTGSIGPGLILRSVFAELSSRSEVEPLFRSPNLVSRMICKKTGALADGRCASLEEWFIPGHEPAKSSEEPIQQNAKIYLERPSQGLQLALDPRIPANLQKFPLRISDSVLPKAVDWIIDGKVIGHTPVSTKTFLWKLERGKHRASARVWTEWSSVPVLTEEVAFVVK